MRENYANPRALGELVLADFRQVIQARFPDVGPNALDRTAADHEAYARRRQETYVPRQDYFGQIEQSVLGIGPPLAVLGESGSGKSALLANWALNHRADQSEDFVIMHFIGSSPDSCDWTSMIRRIMRELHRRFDIEKPIPEGPEALRLAFANLLHVVSEQIAKDDRTRNSASERFLRLFQWVGRNAGPQTPSRRVVIVLDGLNQLDDRQGALDLVWLPSVIPPNVHLLICTLEGRPLDALRQRECSYLKVCPLTDEERSQFIAQYLIRYGKQMDSAQLQRVVSAEQTRNPLYLGTLLEELRLFGSRSGLDAQLQDYLEARTASDLYRKVLVRWEKDYGTERGLVQESMSLLWASRRRLSEAELLDLLGKDGTRLPGAIWSPLYLASEQALLHRDGLITFGHDFLRQAVEITWLPTVALQADVSPLM